MSELRLVIALTAMLTLPGWAILAITPDWREWRALQRWCLAISISIAFYPVLFYTTRAVLPSFQWGPNKIAILLIACAAVIAWRMRGNWREQFGFERLEWFATAIFAMTLFTRVWIIRDHPYPAWTDSLHHTLLTLLTANSGRLPYDMQPYFPIPLGQYHLGLYALSGTLQMLSGAPAHTALLWMAQTLNGLCDLSLYFVLDRVVGRVGAIAGAATVGLFSFQPAWYVNWGRFTQVASQTIVLIAWIMTWDAIKAWEKDWAEYRAEILWKTIVAAMLTAAVFLLHFRVAGFYLPLLAISVVWELIRARADKTTMRVLPGTMVVGVISLLFISPALGEALRIYLSATLKTSTISDDAMAQLSGYFIFPWESVFAIGAEWWMIALAGLGAMIGLFRRNSIVIVSLIWVALLLLIGNVYLLRITPLSFTNLGAILIMLYLPIGLVIGAGVEEALRFFSEPSRERAPNIVLVGLLAAGFIASHIRANGTEAYRYFVTPADVAAMNWISQNTPRDARFAINTTWWVGFPHGTDAGYWIPYFTGRQTTTGTMISPLAGTEETDKLVALSRSVQRLNTDRAAMVELQSLEVNYIYVGAKGNFAEPGLDAARLSQTSGASFVYQRDGVAILQVGNAPR